MNKFDVIVVGGGHAGVEAAHAVERMNLNCALITMRQKNHWPNVMQSGDRRPWKISYSKRDRCT